jgi:hypothetical protein
MKFCGLQGVIIDWYGIGEDLDHAANHQHTLKLVPWLKRAGLRFAVCYEDQALAKKSANPAGDAAAAVQQAEKDLLWAQEHWFADPSYLMHDNRPMLLMFGPQLLKQEQWAGIEKRLSKRPFTFALPHLARSIGAEGAFAWPPVSGGKTLNTEEWTKQLRSLYSGMAKGEHVIATAFPGFKDIYKQAGVGESFGGIPSRMGATFAESLDLALKAGSPKVVTDLDSPAQRKDGNNVLLQDELMAMSKNSAEYEALGDFVSYSMRTLRMAISGKSNG